MPYAPGVESRGGEIFGQYMLEAGKAIAQGIRNASANYDRKQKEKEEHTSAKMLLQEYGGQLGIDTSDEKKLDAMVKGAGADKIVKFANMANEEKQRQDALAEQNNQKRLLQQLAAYESPAMPEGQAQVPSGRDNFRDKVGKVIKIAKFVSGGAGGGEGAGGAGGAGESLGSKIGNSFKEKWEGGLDRARETFSGERFRNSLDKAKATFSGEQFREGMDSGGGAPSNYPQNNFRSLLQNPYVREAMQLYQATGQLPNNQETIAAQRSQGRPDKVLDPVSIRSTGPNGEPIEVSIDRMTGRVLGQGPVTQPKYVRPVEEELQIAGGKAGAEAEAKNAAEFVNSIPEAAEAAQANLAQLQQIKNLYAEGASSGFGQNFMNQAGAAAVRLGLVDPEKQASREELEKLLATSALTTAKDLMKGTGTVSNYERELINKASAEVGKSSKTNMRIVGQAEAVARRIIDQEAERQRLVDEGKNTPQIAEALRRWRSKNTLETYMSMSPAKEQGGSTAGGFRILEIK